MGDKRFVLFDKDASYTLGYWVICSDCYFVIAVWSKSEHNVFQSLIDESLLVKVLGVQAAINNYARCHKECKILRLDEYC